MIARLRRSLGARILLLAALNLVLLVAIGLAASGVRVPRSLRDMIMQSAEPRLQDVARRIALDLERTPPQDASALLDRYGSDYQTRFILVRNDGSLVAGAPLTLPPQVIQALAGPPPGGPRNGFGPPPRGAPARLGPPDRESGLRMPQTPARLISTTGSPRDWIMLRTPIRFAGSAEIIPGSLIVVPHNLFADPLLFPTRWLVWIAIALAVTMACWWPMLRGITTSLGQMDRATSEIADGRFDTTIAVTRGDEIGRLSASIEQMARRLGTAVSGQKRFLGDTAHELRSPLGRMQVALEILDTRVPDAERGYVRDLKEDVESLSRLTDELLQYARAELSDRSRVLQATPLLPIVERAIEREGEDATFTTSVDPDAMVAADPALLERALSNVIRNAVKYAGNSGPIHVESAAADGRVQLAVLDQGPGVAPESLPRLFEPFFREDLARNRKTGGVGLGLAIVRSAIEACGGSVSCGNRQPHGLQVTMTLRSTSK
jgi:two-component system sensor histidine kinase CpxA